MGRQTWATDEQVTWLTGRKKGFTDAQASSTTRAYLNSTLELYIQKWPVEDPSPGEVLDADGDVEKAKADKLQRLRQRIEWWIRNRNRPNGASGKGKGQVLPLARKKVQMMAPYQAYMHLYHQRVMPQLEAAYRTYLASVKEGEKVRHFWSLVTEEAPRLLDEEPEDVKEEVEEYRQRNYQEQLPTPIAFEDLMKEGQAAGQKKVATLQHSINLLPRTGLEALKAIEDQTGFKGTLILGGPNPETGRIVTLALDSIHHGGTIQLENIWPEASDDWPVVQKSFDNFIARCFPAELPAQLEKAFNGEDVDFVATRVTAPAETPPTVMPAISPDTTRQTTGTSNTPLPSANIAANASTSAPPVAAPDAAPSAMAANPSTATNATPAADPGGQMNGMADDAQETHRRVPTPKLSYDDEIRARHARNLRVWRVMEKRPGISAEEAGTIVDADEDIEEPEWIGEAKEHLLEVSEDGWWQELVETWQKFEGSLKYPDGANPHNRLSSKFRPEEAKNWINRGRNYARPSKVKSVAAFTTGFRKWWARLQPACRQVPDGGWPLLRAAPRDDSEWAEVRKAGCNGMFMVLMCLSWWLREVQEKELDAKDLREAADDVQWVLSQLSPTASQPPTSSPDPVSAAPPVASSDAASSPQPGSTITEPMPPTEPPSAPTSAVPSRPTDLPASVARVSTPASLSAPTSAAPSRPTDLPTAVAHVSALSPTDLPAVLTMSAPSRSTSPSTDTSPTSVLHQPSVPVALDGPGTTTGPDPTRTPVDVLVPASSGVMPAVSTALAPPVATVSVVPSTPSKRPAPDECDEAPVFKKMKEAENGV